MNRNGISVAAIRLHGYDIYRNNSSLSEEERINLIYETLQARLTKQEGLENLTLLETDNGYQINFDSISDLNTLQMHLINERDNIHSNFLRKQTISELNKQVKQKIKSRENNFKNPRRIVKVS